MKEPEPPGTYGVSDVGPGSSLPRVVWKDKYDAMELERAQLRRELEGALCNESRYAQQLVALERGLREIAAVRYPYKNPCVMIAERLLERLDGGGGAS